MGPTSGEQEVGQPHGGCGKWWWGIETIGSSTVSKTTATFAAQTLNPAISEGHKGQLRYALRSGVLPLASLFSDWRDALEQQERAYSLALRALPPGQRQSSFSISTEF